MNVPIEPKPLTKPIIADAALRPSISPNSVGKGPANMISGPQFKIPIAIMAIELTNMPMFEVTKNTIRPIALKKIPTVEPSNDLLLK